MIKDLNTLEDFIKNVHKLGYSLIDYRGVKVPCLYVDNSEFDKLMNRAYGKHSLIDTNLNIYDDGRHVFVNLNIKFLGSDFDMDFLMYANETVDFFEYLSLAGMLGIAPHQSDGTNIFFVQLPKKDQAEKAYQLIRSKLK